MVGSNKTYGDWRCIVENIYYSMKICIIGYLNGFRPSLATSFWAHLGNFWWANLFAFRKRYLCDLHSI